MTPLTLSLLLMVPAADQPPSADPKPVPATRDEVKAALEASKKARPRIPMPPPPEPGTRIVNNGNFREYYLSAIYGPRTGPAGFSREPDPAMTLDNTFKVKLFWITSRTNNCYY